MTNTHPKTQCQGITLRGRHCTREALPEKIYCWQHKYIRRNNIPWHRNSLLLTWIGIIITTAGLLWGFCAYHYGPSLVNQEKGLENDKEIIRLLSEELIPKIPSVQNQTEKQQSIVPSERAVELAKKIRPEDGFYALALKAIAEQRNDDARQYLGKTQNEKEIELTDIYETQGKNEYYAGNFKDAIMYLKKTLEILSNNEEKKASVMNIIGMIYSDLGELEPAKALFEESLEINQKLKIYNGAAANYVNLGIIFVKLKDYDSAIKMFNASLELSSKYGYKDNILQAKCNLGATYQIKGEIKKAIQEYEEGISLLAKDDHRSRISLLNNLGVLYDNMGDEKKALSYYNEALDLIKLLPQENKRNINMNLMIIYQNRGGVYANLKEYNKSIIEYKKSLQNAEEAGQKIEIAKTCLCIGNVYYDKKEYDNAIIMFTKTVDIIEKNGDHEDILIEAYNNLGIACLKKDNLGKAIEIYEKRLKLLEAQGLMKESALQSGELGIAYYCNGEIKESIRCHFKALEADTKLENQEAMATDYTNLGSMYFKLNDKEKAEEYWTKAKNIYARIGNIQMEEKVQNWINSEVGE